MEGWQELIDFRSARTSAFELHGDWAGRVTGCGSPGLYLVERGSLIVSVRGQRHRLNAGDVLLLPVSVDHVLGTRDDLVVEPIEHITARATAREGRQVVGAGIDGLEVRSAAFAARPLELGWLPAALLLRRAEAPRGLRHMLRALLDELESGSNAALCPLAEAVFIKAFDHDEQAAFVDPDILRAVGAARQAPERFTRVEELARYAGLSRSRFSERFALAMGEPPMRWLRRVRLQEARAALLGGRGSVAQIAERLGYSSLSAFRKAYRRVLSDAD
jgi:AraC-like DNA-binding protein